MLLCNSVSCLSNSTWTPVDNVKRARFVPPVINSCPKEDSTWDSLFVYNITTLAIAIEAAIEIFPIPRYFLTRFLVFTRSNARSISNSLRTSIWCSKFFSSCNDINKRLFSSDSPNHSSNRTNCSGVTSPFINATIISAISKFLSITLFSYSY